MLAPRRRRRVRSPRASAPQAESARERARGGAAAPRRSTQVMAGRAPGWGGEERGGDEGAGRPSRAAASVPLCVPGEGQRCLLSYGSDLGSFTSWARRLGRRQGPGVLRQGRERLQEGWAVSGLGAWRAWAPAGKWSGRGSAGGRAAQGVWLLEQFKVTLHIRALRPPLSDPDRGGASYLPAPLSGSACLPLPLAQPREVGLPRRGSRLIG